MKKTLIKINDIEELEYGLDGIILGLENYSICFEKTFNISEIKDIIKTVKSKEIFVSLNRPIFNNELDDYKKTLLELDKLGLNGIIVGDIAALTYNLKTNIVLDQLHLNNSSKTVNHYYNNGVSGVLLTNDITLNEINNIRKNTNALLFKQVFGLSHLSTSVRKLLTNYFEYFNLNKKDKTYLISENNSLDFYYVTEDDFGTHILDGKVLNLYKYKNDLDVDYLIIDGYLLDKSKVKLFVNYFLTGNSDVNFDELFESSKGFINKQTIYRVKKDE